MMMLVVALRTIAAPETVDAGGGRLRAEEGNATERQVVPTGENGA